MASLVEQVLTGLKSHGYIASPHIAAHIALLLSQKGVRAMILDGPPGAGKTFLAKCVSAMLNVNYVYVQAHPGSMPEDFLYDINLPRVLRAAAGGEMIEEDSQVYELGFIPEIFELSQHGPVVAFVDELDKASARVDSLFLTALQEGEVIFKKHKIRCNMDNLVLFFTKNNDREVSEPLMRRCRRDYLGFPSPKLELDILMGIPDGTKPRYMRAPEQVDYRAVSQPLAKVLITAAEKLRALDKLVKPPASSELFMAAQDVMRLGDWGHRDLVENVLLSWLAGYHEDRKLTKKSLKMREVADVAYRASQIGQGKAVEAERSLLGTSWEDTVISEAKRSEAA